MATMELTNREAAMVAFSRLSPAEQNAQKAAIREQARLDALARLTPERRALAEQRYADQQTAIAAEKVRLDAMTPEERDAERALLQKAQAEATLASLPEATVSLVAASAKVASAIGATPLKAGTPLKIGE